MAIAHLTYEYSPEGWWAESPEFPGYSAFGASLVEVRLLAHEGLPFFADDGALTVIDPFTTLGRVSTFTATVYEDEPVAPFSYRGGTVERTQRSELNVSETLRPVLV